MKDQGKIINGVTTLYSVTGYGADYDLNSLTTGFNYLMEELHISEKEQRKIWGIVIDTYNQERAGSLYCDAQTYLENNLISYFAT